MNKKILVFLIVILILGVGGFFYWWQNREIKGSPDDYVIKETEEGKFIENKKAGLIVKTPEGWEVEKIEIEEGAGVFYSSKTKINWRDNRFELPLEKGCMIQTTVVYQQMDFEEIKTEAKYTHFMLGKKSEEFEEITLNNYPAIKNIFDTQDSGPGIGIYIPLRNKVYSFYLAWGDNEKQECIQEFNKFLETISIQ